MKHEPEWISAAEALAAIAPDLGFDEATEAIRSCAHAGVMLTRAKRFVWAGLEKKDVGLPLDFWYVLPGQKMSEDWTSGNFQTLVHGVVPAEAYGVSFLRYFLDALVGRQAKDLRSTFNVSVAEIADHIRRYPHEARSAALSLSRLVSNRLDQLNASIPNDPDALSAHIAVVAFLADLHERANAMTGATDAVMMAKTPPEKQSLSERAAQIAKPLLTALEEGVEEHGPALIRYGIAVSLVMCSVWLFSLLGVSPDKAFIGNLAFLGTALRKGKGKPKGRTSSARRRAPKP